MSLCCFQMESWLRVSPVMKISLYLLENWAQVIFVLGCRLNSCVLLLLLVWLIIFYYFKGAEWKVDIIMESDIYRNDNIVGVTLRW